MIKFFDIIREEQISPQQFQRLDKINKLATRISNNTYDFIISQFSKYGIDVTDKNKLRVDVDDTISSEIMIDI